MIKFSNPEDFNRIRYLTLRSNWGHLYNSLYVFTAHSSRPASIYISPALMDAEAIAKFLRQKLNLDVAVEALGNPPAQAWIAFNIKLRDKDPILCSKICLFLERHVNHLITW